MNLEKPLGEQLTESMNVNTNAIKEGVSNMATSMGNTLNAAKESMNNTLDDFSKADVVGASSSFLESNSLIAKFVFLILVMIGFVLVFRFCVIVMGYFIRPDPNPYIIKGMLDGNVSKTIITNPNIKDAIQILRSDDAASGLEFTWSFWIYIQDNKTQTSSIKYNNIFVKGDGIFDASTGLSSVNNGPGVYLANKDDSVIGAADKSYASLYLVMDTVTTPGNGVGGSGAGQVQETFDISNIPMQKWVYIALRMQNKIMDVYVNGIVTKRQIFINIPKQNYNNIVVCGNGGFNGKLSNLRYFSHALNALEIGSVLAQGPNTNSLSSVTGPGTMQYLSMNWYSNT
jgi:hypothetical protein